MKNLAFRWLYILCLLALAGGPARSQTVSPVFSQTLLQAPYLYRLQDWADMPAPRLQVRLRMLDTRVGTATLYLKMELESDRIKLGNPYPLPIGINLSGGEEIVLDGSQLGIYFLGSNLHVSGADASQFHATGGILPDGMYELRFKAYEAASGNQVSIQETPAMFHLVSSEPPLLTFPAENATVFFKEPCQIRFQWLPRHLQAAAGFQTEYLFEIAEIPQGVDNWKEYFHTLPLIHSQNTSACFVDYGPHEPELLPEKAYAIRVQARCTNAMGENLYIKNEGYSQVQRFSYKESCPAVSGVRIDQVTSQSARISWNEPVEARSYKLLYRKNGKPDARWFSLDEELPVGSQSATLPDLKPSTGYECKIQTHCVHTRSQDDVVYRFTTLSKDNASLECGNHNLSPDSTRSTQPLEKLMRFDQIRTANGFVIEVEEAQGEQGTFSGSGYTRIPLLANTGVKVKFKNVFINKNYELVSGSIEAEKDKNSL